MPKTAMKACYKLPTGLLPARHRSTTTHANRWIGLDENAMTDTLLACFIHERIVSSFLRGHEIAEHGEDGVICCSRGLRRA